MPNNKKNINTNCTCPNTSCSRHGDCAACTQHHRFNSPFCKTIPANPEDERLEITHSRFHKHYHGKAIAILCSLLLIGCLLIFCKF